MSKIFLTIITLISFGSLFTIFAQSESYLKNRIFVEGLYTRNIGNFGNVWSNSSGGYLGYGIAFPEHNYLMMRTGVISNKLKDKLSNQESLTYDGAYLTIIPLEVGGRYYFNDNVFMPFAQFMTGLNFIFQNKDLVGKNENKILVKYAWQIGLGFTINLVSDFCIDAGVNYQSNFYDTEAMNTGFEYTIGIGYAIGN